MIFVSSTRVHLVQKANEMYVFVWQIEMGGEQCGLRPIQNLAQWFGILRMGQMCFVWVIQPLLEKRTSKNL